MIARAQGAHLALVIGALCAGCGSTQTTSELPTEEQGAGRERTQVSETTEGAHAKQSPPPSGTPRDIHFPPIARSETGSGLELDVVEKHDLPVVHIRLVTKSGDSSDPRELPGLAHLTTSMLREGTRTLPSARLADEVEFLGADLQTGSDTESSYIAISALSEHFDRALELVADVALHPAFSDAELRKLKRREIDRLALQSNDPGYLASREFSKALYGDHPYAHIDTTRQAVDRVRRSDLQRWHRTHFVPNNTFLVVVGDVPTATVRTAAERVFGRWRRGTVTEPPYPQTPTRQARQVIVVDRPESVQSVIMIGNLALERSSPDFVPLLVANQVLGGSAASRLFMDLRERRSLTYGAYSRVGETVKVAPFRASASVRNEVTAQAMSAFMEHLRRIVAEAAPASELADAQRYLSDSFPLRIDTPGKIAGLVADLRIFGLPDDYWDGFRTQIRGVTSARAHEAARRYIDPDKALIVVVGKAADVVPALREYGNVSVVDTNGEPVRDVPAGG